LTFAAYIAVKVNLVAEAHPLLLQFLSPRGGYATSRSFCASASDCSFFSD
jgi:hypothetical protein